MSVSRVTSSVIRASSASPCLPHRRVPLSLSLANSRHRTTCLSWPSNAASSFCSPSSSRCFSSASSSSPASSSPSSAASIVQVTAANFGQLFESPNLLILDCYADWCQPCKSLSPKLTAAVKDPRFNLGKWQLCMLNSDKEADVAASLGVESLPTVFAIKHKQLVNKFVGDKSKEFIADFLLKALHISNQIDQLPQGQQQQAKRQQSSSPAAPAATPSASVAADVDSAAPPAELLQTGAGLLNGGKPADAKRVLSLLLSRTDSEAQKQFGSATAVLVQCYLALARQATDTASQGSCLGEAELALENLRAKAKGNRIVQPQLNSKELATATVQLELTKEVLRVARNGKTLSQLESELAADPKNEQLRADIILMLFASGQVEQAILSGLDAVKLNKQGLCKAMLLKLLDSLGNNNLVSQARKRLANILY